ncbi:SMI1/KNR4 family protein [Streptomyces sp. NBC_00102]|uniref:SMI1/KNR4 family protein n=1 Tax=Streptomyces sp. NBC_00102 TaxID=2975652 RepID=UPI00225A43CE|nr:SMI1/KNR4 family protein [Streptomyces sp. NBC_00102]MCX5401782.1 SMI1/KNR4 family protein [Streptomyces sp. NBC_00102]
MELSRFREMLGAPMVNGDVDQDWREVESVYGAGLPEDYKNFVSAYGPGCINDQLYVFHPRASRGEQGLRLFSLWSQVASSHQELSRLDPDLYPYSVYPADGGLVPIARSISGNLVFLSPASASGAGWGVAVEMGGWAMIEQGFSDFLWAALNGELFIPIIEGAAKFEPLGNVE